MSYMRNVYYNLMAIQNNIIINVLLIGNLFYPTYFNDKINYYRSKGETYYKYLLLLTINNEIVKKYNIDLIDIGMGLYDKYNKLMNNKDIQDIQDDYDDDMSSVISEASDTSDLSEISDTEDELI